MIDLRDVRSVTEFQRNLKEYFARLRKNRNPLVLTVNGRAEVVVQDAEGYQKLLDRLEHAEALAGIKRGLQAVKQGRSMPLDKAVTKLRKKHGF